MIIIDALNTEVKDKALAEKFIIQQGLNPDDVYSASNIKEVELCKAYCFKALLTQPDWSEDGLSVSYNRNYLIAEANRIFELNGLSDLKISTSPKISNGTSLW